MPRDWARVASAPPRSISREVVDADADADAAVPLPNPVAAVAGELRRGGMPNGPTAEVDFPGTRGVANASDSGRRQTEKMARVQHRAPRRVGLLKLVVMVAASLLPWPPLFPPSAQIAPILRF